MSQIVYSTTTGRCTCGGELDSKGLCFDCFPTPAVAYEICTCCFYEKPKGTQCGLPCV